MAISSKLSNEILDWVLNTFAKELKENDIEGLIREWTRLYYVGPREAVPYNPLDVYLCLKDKCDLDLLKHMETIPENFFSGITKGKYPIHSSPDKVSLVIPDNIRRIWYYAFFGCQNLSAVTIPGSVFIIDCQAFLGCHNLKEVEIQAGVRDIGLEAFKDCINLEKVSIPSSVEEISDYAFQGCTSLTEVIIPEGVKRVGEFAFKDCINLRTVELPDSLTWLGYGAFDIGDRRCMSQGTSPLSIKYDGKIFHRPSSIKKYFMLKREHAVKFKTIEEALISIQENATLELEESAKTDFIDKFGEDTFNNFVKAKDRLLNKGYSSDFGQYLKKSKEEVDNLILSLYDNEKDAQKKRIIQGTDKEIRGEYRDLGVKGGYHVYEPLDVYASIDLGVNTGWCTTGRYGHYGHPEFTPSIVDARKHWNSYTKKGIRFFYLLDPETMYGKYAIALYPKVVGKKGLEIGRYSVKRTNIEIYNDKDYLDYALYKQLDLSDIINENVVFEADLLDEVEIKDNILTKYHGSDRIFKIPDTITSIGDHAFDFCDSLRSIMIPDSVISIGTQAFWNCSNLASVMIGNGVTSIGSNAFEDCISLKKVIIGNSVNSISNCAFQGCSSLTDITIPNKVTKIGFYAFAGCTDLTNIKIPDSVTSIGVDAFYNCSSLTSIEIPSSVTNIGDGAFLACFKLTKVIIDNGITSISPFAFNECSHLTDITIPGSVTSIGIYAFEDCSRLTNITFNGTKAQWQAISKSTNWKSHVPSTCKVICTDETININDVKED